jgi:hypothetical protein
VPLIGATFSVIIIRISLGFRAGDTPSSHPRSFTNPPRHIRTIGGTGRSNYEDIELGTSDTTPHRLELRDDAWKAPESWRDTPDTLKRLKT